MLLNTVIIAVVVLLSWVLLSKHLRDNRRWRATVTPLASIIGSGFLVVVPLLGNSVGVYAPLAMVGIVVFAYLIGGVIRYNIGHAEKSSDTGTVRLERIATLALASSYFVSIAFYLRLLASFVFHSFGTNAPFAEQLLTTSILVFIGVAGWARGLGFLERLEEYSVSIKLAIIGALLVGWAAHDVGSFSSLRLSDLPEGSADGWQIVRVLAGVLIVVQGFETSRYLGDEYDAETRITTMKFAQLISGMIYVLFVAFTVPSFGLLSENVDETAIIELSRSVATVLPIMLIVAAVMSQLSAAVADTVASGGLFTEAVGVKFGLSAKWGYALVTTVGVVLIWTTNVFELVALASRAFAVYYAIQAAIAARAAWSHEPKNRLIIAGGFGFLALMLTVSAVIAIPAG